MTELTQKRLLEALDYDPDTGFFTWKLVRTGRRKTGSVAGYKCPRYGTIRIRIDGRNYQAHRLAFLFMNGYWAENEVDHINSISGDNRWCNLREATRSQNSANRGVTSRNKLGVKGISKSHNRYRVDVQSRYIGQFKTLKEACEAYNIAAMKIYREFAQLTGSHDG